ncbi:CoA-dependent acyltransferase [Serendipita vermifera]|nr:CoA-dependent acyltransferase [Serendipita vermifera]
MLSRIYSRSLIFRNSPTKLFGSQPVRYASRKIVRPFLLADIGEGITECEVIKWTVQTSSPVQTFDPLCEVQSDKATVEITSPYDGTIKEILVKEGEIAKVGSQLCLIEVTEDDANAENVTESEKPAEQGTRKESVTEKEQGSVVTSPEPSASTTTRRKHPLDPSNDAPAKASDGHVLATPSVRHLARHSGIKDLSVLAPGSGRDGRIEKADVEAYLAGEKRKVESSVPAAPQVSGEDVRLDLGRTRYAMWKSMTKSLEIPHFGYSSTLDLTALNSLLPAMNSYIPPQYQPSKGTEHPPAVSPNGIWGASPPSLPESDPKTHYQRLTILPLLLKALSRAMQEWAIFRSSINPKVNEDEKPSITIRPHSDIAIAVSTTSGLYTPVIQAVDTKSPYDIMAELRRFQSLGRQTPAAFTPKELPKKGATISVSNVGAIGKGEWASPLLVPGGGVAIVAIGRAKWVERFGEKRLEVGVSWSADHRIVEGAEMAAFVESWRSWVEEPARLIADGK